MPESRKPVQGVGNFTNYQTIKFFPSSVLRISFSGFGSRDENQQPITGRIQNTPASIEHGEKAAAGAARNFLCNLKEALRENHIDTSDPNVVIKLDITVHINAADDLKCLPKIADAVCAEIDAFFKSTRLNNFCKTHLTRTALGHNTLPNDMSVEVSVVAWIEKKCKNTPSALTPAKA